MIKYLKLLSTILLLFPLWGQGGYLFAQNYPVQCTPILTPPYTLSWVEYGSSPERLKVQLLLKDLTKPSAEVSLRIRLKGIGVVIENTPDFYTSSPITLLPGVPVMLSGAMLRENFKYENLSAQGVDLETLYAGLSLPGGFYTWEITAFLADQRQVSNVGMAMMTVFKNNPPQITFPQNNAVLMNTGFQSINFTWMPRHRYSTNAAAGTIYTFKIYEIPTEENAGDASQETDPNVIVNSGVLPLFSTQTFGTNYLYKPSDPVLVPGRRYVIQVQAGDINGNDEFENNGLSEVSTFSFGNPREVPAPKLCKKPNNFLAEQLDEQSVQLTWQESNTEAPIDYIVNYKAENEGVWAERIVSDPSLLLIQLTPNKYQFKVSARCTYDNKSTFTNDENLELSKPVEEKEILEMEMQETYVNTDEPVTVPPVYIPETDTKPNNVDLIPPVRISFDTEDIKNLPESVKIPKGYETLASLPVLTDNPTLDQLKEALQVKKADCSALLANYQCGQNEILSVPSGDIIQPNVGDEIAINSIAFEVVELDGSGNGRGIVKVPMFQNAKFGVEFKGIKVAKGGCVVAGQAILSDVDVAILSEEQRKKLAETYATFNNVLTIADSLAPQIAQTINKLTDAINKLASKINEKKNNTKALLENFTIDKEATLIQNCVTIANDSKTLQDSLEKTIDLVKKGKVKADLTSLLAACKNNVAFMNELAPALAKCQGLAEPQLRDVKSCGPCASPWDMMPVEVLFVCNEAMNGVFGVGTVNQESIDYAAESIKEDPNVLQIVKNIKAISDFFEQCKGENWKPYSGGVIPYCLWKDASNVHKYSPLDAAFVSGIIDNFYGQYEGLKNIFSTVEQIHTSVLSTTYDIIQAYFKDCSPKKIKLNQREYRILVNKLAEDSDQDNVWGWVKYQLDEKEIVEVKTDLIECENAKKLKAKINNLVDFINDYPKMAVSLGKIISRSEVYLKKLKNTDVNENRYKHGKIVAEVVSLVTPVVISKVGKLRAIEEISVDVEKNLGKFEKELARVVPEGEKRVVQGAGKVAKLSEKLNVSDYATSAKNSIKDGMTPDHIPSFAALKKNLEIKLGRELDATEATQLYNEGTSILYETTLHQQFSRTFGGRNSASQIADDAKDLFQAVQKDMDALRKPLKNSGMSDADIEKAFELVHEMNRKKGLY